MVIMHMRYSEIIGKGTIIFQCIPTVMYKISTLFLYLQQCFGIVEITYFMGLAHFINFTCYFFSFAFSAVVL